MAVFTPNTKKGNQRFFYMKNSDDIREFLKCQRSIVYFINTYIKIQHPIRGRIPFNLYPFQIALLRVYLLHRFNITLKPRQMGISTLICAYALWLAMFHPHKFISIISIKANLARNLLRKIRFMYTGLPDCLKMEVVNGGAGTYGTADRIAFSNGSEINAEAATENAARSEALSCLIMDEVAFQRYASGIWSAAYPTLATGGQAILLSTAFGVGNLFHQLYTDGVQGLNPFYSARLDWRMHPDRGDAWYQETLRSMGAKRTAQEIDCDFLQSGYNVFDMGKIKSIEERLFEKTPSRTMMDGQLLIYHEAQEGVQYCVGADVASGRARDFSTFSVFDPHGKEMACYKGKIGIRDFGHLLMKTGHSFNEALLAPESNAIGEGVISTLQENGYQNVYNTISKTMKLGNNEYQESEIFGWLTTGKSRNEIITGMDDDLNDDLVEINNPFFVQEAYTFVYSGMSNKPIALGKELGRSTVNSMYDDQQGGVYTDDSILAACIGNEVRKKPQKYRSALPFGVGGE